MKRTDRCGRLSGTAMTTLTLLLLLPLVLLTARAQQASAVAAAARQLDDHARKTSGSNLVIDSKPQQQQQHQANQPVQTKWLNSLAELVELLAHFNREAARLHNSQQLLVVDTRSSNEYNGWKSFDNSNDDDDGDDDRRMRTGDSIAATADKLSLLLNQTSEAGLLALYDAKNGHLTDAHNFDADWLSLSSAWSSSSLNSLVTERLGLNESGSNAATQIAASSLTPIVLYDTRRERLERVSAYFTQHFAVGTVFLCRINQTELSALMTRAASNESATALFFQEPFYDMLLSAEVLNTLLKSSSHHQQQQQQQLNGVPVSAARQKPLVDYKLFEVSASGPEAHYERGHIPSAVHLSTLALEDGRTHVRHNRSELARALLAHGVLPNNSEMIVLYGNPEPMAAFRAALLLKWMGVRDVHVLNGGIRAWTARHWPLETGSSKRQQQQQQQQKQQQQQQPNGESLIKAFEDQSINSQTPINYIVDVNYVADIVKNYELFAEHYALVDIRSYAEYTAGRVPHSVWGRAGVSAVGDHQLADYRNPDSTMRSGVEILQMWDRLGVDYKNKHLIFYCGNGWRSAEVLFYAELMGLYRISLYDRGWLDWSSATAGNAIQLGNASDSGDVITLTTEWLPAAEAAAATSNASTVAATTAPLSTTIAGTQPLSLLTTSRETKQSKQPPPPTTARTSTKHKAVGTTSSSGHSNLNSLNKNQFDAVTASSAITAAQNGFAKIVASALATTFIVFLVFTQQL